MPTSTRAKDTIAYYIEGSGPALVAINGPYFEDFFTFWEKHSD